MYHRIPLVILAFALIAGCADNEPAPPVKPRSTMDDELERLRALGYTSWDKTKNSKLRGVTTHDRERTAKGYNLFTNDVDRAYLMDNNGKVVHTWRFEGKRNCQHVELQENGDLLAVCVEQSFTRMDWSSKVVFNLRIAADHDFAVLPDGSYLVAFLYPPRNYKGRPVIFDGIAHLNADGTMRKVNWWPAFKHIEALKKHHAPSFLDRSPKKKVQKNYVFDYYHLNTLEVLPATPLGESDPRFRAGNFLICLRNVHLIAVLDQDDLSVTWSWGKGELDMPHMPTMLPDGNILLFDNGMERKYSRVLEITPSTGEIVWEYKGDPLESFFSELRGGIQRLENGNTLICESERGRVFEVTREGEIVWEFWNPDMADGKRKRIYRFHRLNPALVEPLLER